jgi:hypothetical protein
MRVKPLASIADKWSTRAQAAGQAYKDGVSASTDWATNTAQSAGNWATGVQQAASDGRFEKGVNAAGNATWQSGAINKGAGRYGPGVGLAKDKFSSGFSKFAQALTNATLPARFPKGDPQNVNRVQTVVTLLRNVKLGKA